MHVCNEVVLDVVALLDAGLEVDRVADDVECRVSGHREVERVVNGDGAVEAAVDRAVGNQRIGPRVRVMEVHRVSAEQIRHAHSKKLDAAQPADAVARHERVATKPGQKRARTGNVRPRAGANPAIQLGIVYAVAFQRRDVGGLRLVVA